MTASIRRVTYAVCYILLGIIIGANWAELNTNF